MTSQPQPRPAPPRPDTSPAARLPDPPGAWAEEPPREKHEPGHAGLPVARPAMRSWTRVDSFRYAFHGWWYVIRTQRNAWIHTIISVLVIMIGLWLGLDLDHWAMIVLAMSGVWMAEFLNTAMEAVVDLASPQLHPLAKVGKDVAAAAVLVAATAAVVVGLLILAPPLWTRLFGA